jgi:hypothetical protein
MAFCQKGVSHNSGVFTAKQDTQWFEFFVHLTSFNSDVNRFNAENAPLNQPTTAIFA